MHRPGFAIRCCLGLALLAGLGGVAAQGLPASTADRQAAEPKRVLILIGADSSLPGTRQFDDAFRKALQGDNPGGVTFFTDTLDAQRFSYAALAPEFLALERKKYANQRVDLVFGLVDGAVDFIRDHGQELWPGVPVLLSGLDDGHTDRSRLPAGASALLWRLDIDGTLDIVDALQPAAQRLIVVGGSADYDRNVTARVVERAAARSRWQVETWDRYSAEELRARLAPLDRTSAVLFTSMLRDGTGRATFSRDSLSRFSETSGTPIYGLYGPYVGNGVVGGKVVDFAELGRLAAEQARAILEGLPQPAQGAVSVATATCIADYRQLQRHGLAASKLPPGCELRNPPRNLWTEYRDFVLAAAAVVLLQALTISALLLQQRRRRTAEAEALLRRSELARAMRFAAMGELTASIAHEINQPLGAILSNADAAAMLLRAGTATREQLQEILSDIRRDDLRAHEVIRRLRALLEKHEVEQTEVSLHAALSDVVLLLAPEAGRRGVTIEHHFEANDDTLLGDAIQLQQVLLNLALNAMDAMETTAADARRLSIRTADHGHDLELTVADRGCGIDVARRDRVFDSFHTTKPHGMGLGLSIVGAIVEAHEGQISVAARDGGGTVFSVRLPRRLTVAQTTLPAADARVEARPGPGLAQRS